MLIKAKMNRGSVLLLCLGVLALLSLLGTALLFIARGESKTAKEYLDQTRASFVAESGIESASAKILSFEGNLTDLHPFLKAQPETPSLPMEYLVQPTFASEDRDGDGVKESSGFISETYSRKGDAFKLRVVSTQGKLNINDTNSPSNIDTDPYADQEDPDRDLALVPDHLKPREDPTKHASPITTKDVDWIYPDDADNYDPTKGLGKPYPKAEGRLEILVRELLRVILPPFEESKPAGPDNPNPNAIAAKIFAQRRLKSGDRFSNFQELESLLVPNDLLPGDFKHFKEFLTLHSWQDDKVLLPTYQWFISRPPTDPSYVHCDLKVCWVWGLQNGPCPWPLKRPKFGKSNGSWLNGLEAGRPGFTYHDNRRDIYLFSDMQTSGFALDTRSPVDLNSAPVELLKAMIRPVQAWYLKEAPGPEEPWYQDKTPDQMADEPPPPPDDTPIPYTDLAGNVLDRPTAEDWSYPSNGLGWTIDSYHNWFIGCGRVVYLMTPGLDPLGGLSLTGALAWPWGGHDTYYYYMDEIASLTITAHPDNVTNPALPRNFRNYYFEKNGRCGRLCEISLLADLADQIAEKLYARIHPAPTTYVPFRTWEEFSSYLYDLTKDDKAIVGSDPNGHLPGFRREMADMLLANFNPNSRLNDFNPGKNGFQLVDKSQLIQYTSEFSFHTMGEFEITCLGEVRGEQNEVVSSSKINALMNPGFVPYRLTTQSQFMDGYEPKGGTGLQAGAYLGESTGGVTRTAGLKWNGSGADLSYIGHSLQSYPEPEMFNENWIKDSVYDGYLMLSVYKPAQADLAFPNQRFYAPLNGGLNPELPATGADLAPQVYSDKWIPDTYSTGAVVSMEHTTSWSYSGPEYRAFKHDANAKVPGNFPGLRRLTKSLNKDWTEVTSGNYFPDGGYSDAGRALRYPSTYIGNAASKGQYGALQFWIKPGFDVTHSNRIRQFMTLSPKDVAINTDPATGDHIFAYDTNPANGLNPAIEDPNFQKCFGQEFTMYYFSHGGARLPQNQIQVDTGMNIYTPDMQGEWISSRALFMTACGGNLPDHGSTSMETFQMPGLGTPSVNHSWYAPGAFSPTEIYNMESHQWSILSMSWNLQPALATTRMHLAVNGQTVLGRDFNMGTTPPDLHTLTSGGPNYIRFGESSSAPFRSEVADSTYDCMLSSDQNSAQTLMPLENLEYEYDWGRFYSDSTIAYTSPNTLLFQKLGLKEGLLKLHSVYWTLLWPKVPKAEYKPSDPRFNDNLNPATNGMYAEVETKLRTSDGPYPADPMATFPLCNWGQDWAPVSIDIVDPSNNSWYYGGSAEATGDMPNFAGGSRDKNWVSKPLIWNASKAFQFKIHFNVKPDATLYVSPILDDITFLFVSSKDSVFVWEPKYQE